MKNLIWSSLAASLIALTAQAEVKITRIENTYQVEVQGEDLKSLKVALPSFAPISILSKTADWKIMTADLNGTSKSYGTFQFGGLDKPLLTDERSSYRRIGVDGVSYLRLSISNRDQPWIEEFFSAMGVPPVRKGSKIIKAWASGDGLFKISCTNYVMPIVLSHECIFLLVEP